LTTSNTYTFDPANADLVLEAFERIGKRSNQLDGNMLRSAARSANFICSNWANLGINLWKVGQTTVPLVQGVSLLTLPISVSQVLTVYLTPSGASDRILYPFGRDDYMSIPNKTDQAPPNAYWFNRTSTPTLQLWPVPDSGGPYTLTYAAMLRQMDFGATMAQTADLPYRFLDAFCADLAVALSVKFAPERLQVLMPLAQKALNDARAEDRELAPISISPDLSSYWN